MNDNHLLSTGMTVFFMLARGRCKEVSNLKCKHRCGTLNISQFSGTQTFFSQLLLFSHSQFMHNYPSIVSSYSSFVLVIPSINCIPPSCPSCPSCCSDIIDIQIPIQVTSIKAVLMFNFGPVIQEEIKSIIAKIFAIIQV